MDNTNYVLDLIQENQLLKDELIKENQYLKEQLSKLREADEEGDEDEGPSTEEKEAAVDQLQAQVASNLNAGVPTLELDDGTQSNIALDSSNQTSPLGQDLEEYKIIFPSGNYQDILDSAQRYSNKITTLKQTLVPLIEKALIELLGNSNAFKRVSFNGISSVMDNTVKIDCEAIYHADNWIGTDIPEEFISHDQNYIYQTITVIPELTIRNTKIDTSTGDVLISISL